MGNELLTDIQVHCSAPCFYFLVLIQRTEESVVPVWIAMVIFLLAILVFLRLFSGIMEQAALLVNLCCQTFEHLVNIDLPIL